MLTDITLNVLTCTVFLFLELRNSNLFPMTGRTFLSFLRVHTG